MTTRLIHIAFILCLIIIVLMAFALRVVYVTPSCDAECRDIAMMRRVINTSAYCLANGGYSYSCWQTSRDIVLGVRR